MELVLGGLYARAIRILPEKESILIAKNSSSGTWPIIELDEEVHSIIWEIQYSWGNCWHTDTLSDTLECVKSIWNTSLPMLFKI